MPRPLNELTRYLYQISNSSENSSSSTTIPNITTEVCLVKNVILEENAKQTIHLDSFSS